ncbi:hypothetical protein BBJ28_00027256, partial [Nothophytophthora sp. Chile5]
MRWLVFLLGATLVGSCAASTTNTYTVGAIYADNTCLGIPLRIYIDESTNCAVTTCNGLWANSTTFCTSNYTRDANNPFEDAQYVLMERFNDETCSTFNYSEAYPVTGTCMSNGSGGYVIVQLAENGTVSIQWFGEDATCATLAQSGVVSVDKEALDAHSCVDYRKWYPGNFDSSASSSGTSSSSTGGTVIDNGTDGSSSGGLSTGAIVGIAAGCFVVLFVVLGVFCCRRRSKGKRSETQLQGTASLQSNNTASLEGAPRGQVGLWDDDVITAKRIPRDQVQVQKLLSRGAYGEVYSGVFNRERVAVKMLLPGTRGNLRQVNEFLAEAKMTATMDHPRIVSFIGVAWNALTDLCVVLEFVDGGDLRTLLNKYEAGRHPVGFDREKVTIALHVCHALT